MDLLKCPSCFTKRSHIGILVCKSCGYKFAELQSDNVVKYEKEQRKIHWSGNNPRCPNETCENSSGKISVKDAFRVATIEQGLMGKVFRQDAVNMVYCTKCGHIIGVASKG